MLQCVILKKARVEEEETPPPPSTESTRLISPASRSLAVQSFLPVSLTPDHLLVYVQNNLLSQICRYLPAQSRMENQGASNQSGIEIFYLIECEDAVFCKM